MIISRYILLIFLLIFPLNLLSQNLKYQVRKGDTLGGILFSFNISPIWGKGNKLEQTLNLNKDLISNSSTIEPQTIITLPLEFNQSSQLVNYTIKEGETLGQVLYSMGVSPLWGKDGNVYKICKLNLLNNEKCNNLEANTEIMIPMPENQVFYYRVEEKVGVEEILEKLKLSSKYGYENALERTMQLNKGKILSDTTIEAPSLLRLPGFENEENALRELTNISENNFFIEEEIYEDEEKSFKEIINELSNKKAAFKSIKNSTNETKQKDDVLPLLIDNIGAKDSETREMVVEALGKLKSQKVVDPLIHTLKDESKEVRIVSAESLGELKNIKAIGPLIEALNDEDEEVRASIASALGRMDNHKATNTLTKTLSDKSDLVQGISIESLDEIAKYDPEALKNPGNIDNLIKSYESDNPWLRAYIVKIFGKLDEEKTIDLILDGLDDEHEFVRKMAIKAIIARKYEEVFEVIAPKLEDDSFLVRAEAAEALGDIGNLEIIDELVFLLDDENSFVRSAAIKSLTKLTNKDFADDTSKWKDWWEKYED